MQIVLNVFRRKPLKQVLPAAAAAGVGIIARVPLASGLLSGKYDESTRFAADDHRSYNRHGEVFDMGETFSGVPYDVGAEAFLARRLEVPALLGELGLADRLVHPTTAHASITRRARTISAGLGANVALAGAIWAG